MDKLLVFLNTVSPLGDKCLQYLSDHLKTKKLEKDEFLLKAGHICQNIYFIEQGLLGCHYEKDGKQVSSWFMAEGDVAISLESFYMQIPSTKSIQALEESLLYYISFNELQEICRENTEFMTIQVKLLVKYYIQSEQRGDGLRCQTSKERVQWMQDNFPQLMARVPQIHLAPFLDMIPGRFCTVKNEISYYERKII